MNATLRMTILITLLLRSRDWACCGRKAKQACCQHKWGSPNRPSSCKVYTTSLQIRSKYHISRHICMLVFKNLNGLAPTYLVHDSSILEAMCMDTTQGRKTIPPLPPPPPLVVRTIQSTRGLSLLWFKSVELLATEHKGCCCQIFSVFCISFLDFEFLCFQ